jgi:hypothetical protein
MPEGARGGSAILVHARFALAGFKVVQFDYLMSWFRGWASCDFTWGHGNEFVVDSFSF